MKFWQTLGINSFIFTLNNPIMRWRTISVNNVAETKPPAGTGFTHVQPQSGQTWDTHALKGTKA